MDLEVRHLRLIVTIADAGGLSAAARRLGISQPTVTVGLQRIEHMLDERLFDRGVEGATPTAAGREVLRCARSVLRGLDEVVASARHRPDLPVRLALAVAPVELFDEVARRWPAEAWTVRNGTSRACVAAVRSGGADLGVLALPADSPDWAEPGVTAVPVLSLRPHAVLPPGHRLAGAGSLDLTALATERWLVGPAPPDQDVVVRECRNAGFEPVQRVVVTDQAAMVPMVARGLGVTITPVPASDPSVVRVPYATAGRVALVVVLATGAPPQLLDAACAAVRHVFAAEHAVEPTLSGAGRA